MNCEKLLKQAAYELIGKKSIDKVTVNDILKTAEVSKQTFYRHYHDKYELGNALYDDLFIKDIYILDSVRNGTDWENMYLRQFAIFRHHMELTKNLFSSREQGCAVDYEVQHCIAFDKAFLHRQGANIEDPIILFALEAKDVGGTFAMRKWILGDMQVSDDEMVHRFKLIIPSILTPYFCN